MRSTSGGGAQGSKRGLDDAGDHGVVAEPGLRGRSGEASVRAEAGIHVDLKDEGLALLIGTEVDARIARKAEQAPAGQRKLVQARSKLRLVTLKSEATGRADIALAIRPPLGIVTHDLGSGRGKPLEDNLGDG